MNIITLKVLSRNISLSSILISTILTSTKPLLAQQITEGAKTSIFLEKVRQNASPETIATQAYFSNKTKVAFAKNVCKSLNKGMAYKDIAAMIKQASRPCPRVHAYGYMTTVAVAGVSTYCPELLSQISN